MNRKLLEFQSLIKDKKVAVLGVGISNKPLIEYIYKFGAVITAFDMADESDQFIQKTKDEFKDRNININWSLGANYLDALKGFDIIFKTPKIRVDLPELVRERIAETIVTSEMEVFVECCPCKIIAVTGSDGKTTTTTMISLLLKEEGYTVHVGGNIGTPLLSRIDTINESDLAVLELSSFQLHSMRKSPDIAVITNISPNHLDVHKDYQEYIEAKKNIFLYQGVLGKLVLNYLNETTKEFAKDARGQVTWFQKIGNQGYYYDDNNIYFPKCQCLPRDQIMLVGSHNVENYCAAIAAVYGMVSTKTIENVLRSFAGVEHRIEFVREIDNVAFYNSSIDSSPTRAKATLKAFLDANKRVVVIAGGKDKNSDYSDLGNAILQVSNKIILCGQNSKMIQDSIEAEIKNIMANSDGGNALQQETTTDLDNGTITTRYTIQSKSGVKSREIVICEVFTYENAIKKARELAIKGESIVLTPAGTSFDRFRNFEERGNKFKNLVNSL